MKRTMELRGEHGGYSVHWGVSGFSWAVPVVKKKAKLFGFIPILRKVWVGDARHLNLVEKMYPAELRDWFQLAVNEYERYAEAWGEVW